VAAAAEVEVVLAAEGYVGLRDEWLGVYVRQEEGRPMFKKPHQLLFYTTDGCWAAGTDTSETFGMWEVASAATTPAPSRSRGRCSTAARGWRRCTAPHRRGTRRWWSECSRQARRWTRRTRTAGRRCSSLCRRGKAFSLSGSSATEHNYSGEKQSCIQHKDYKLICLSAY